MMKESENFGLRLKELRTERGDALEVIAKYTGITRSLLSKYERGITEPGIGSIEKLADYFNVYVDWLIGRSDIKRPTEDEVLLLISKLSTTKKQEAVNYLRFLHDSEKE